MSLSNPYANYQDTQVKTASPISLIILLYEGALKDITKGEALLHDETGYAEATKHLLRAMNIVTELQGILNPDQSKEIAGSLSETYKAVLVLIGGALAEKNPVPLIRAANIMNSLLTAWREAADQLAQQAG